VSFSRVVAHSVKLYYLKKAKNNKYILYHFRFFYNHVFVQTLCHVLEHVSCNVEQRKYSIAFSGTLHHANDKSSLRTMFDIYNGSRLATTLVLLIVAMHGQINTQGAITKSKSNLIEKYKNLELNPCFCAAANFSLGVLLNLVLAFQLCLLVGATMWPWLNTRSHWGKLMKVYSSTTDKLDVVRGRSVPSPKKGAGAAGKSSKYKAHRVLRGGIHQLS
jgi:hypothetical protein